MAGAEAPAKTQDKGNAPDNVRGLATQALPRGRVARESVQRSGYTGARCGAATESATENRPPAERSTVAVAQGNLSDVYRMLAKLGKGEKVG
jgi:hypothetical protein